MFSNIESNEYSSRDEKGLKIFTDSYGTIFSGTLSLFLFRAKLRFILLGSIIHENEPFYNDILEVAMMLNTF